MGDFNVRVGRMYVFDVIDFGSMNDLIEERISLDVIVNDEVLDRPANFTHVIDKSELVIDYTLISLTCLNAFADFVVEPWMMSDHLPIRTELSTKIANNGGLDIRNCLIHAAKKANLLKEINCRKRKGSWFDKECIDLKKNINKE
ncbi:hypothetical protein CHUAL_009509 [Chamberlinius hualienensis]